MDKLKLVAISDTHGLHDNLTKDLELGGDIIIHAGDISNTGKSTEIYNFLQWFSSLNFKHKIFIAGNHDFGFEVNDDIAQEYKDQGVIYLMDRMVEVEGLKIYGSPWQPRFYDWAFNVDRGEAIAKKWAPIPEGLDVLVTHGPIFGILDDTYTGQRVGCEELYKKVMEVRPKVHICGHIHYGYGMRTMDDMMFLNAASLGENYRYTNKPIVFHL
jgi:Icc-related predicted phosphoesterase